MDLRVWNEEARRQGVLERLARGLEAVMVSFMAQVPYTKWLGQHSTMKLRPSRVPISSYLLQKGPDACLRSLKELGIRAVCVQVALQARVRLPRGPQGVAERLGLEGDGACGARGGAGAGACPGGALGGLLEEPKARCRERLRGAGLDVAAVRAAGGRTE